MLPTLISSISNDKCVCIGNKNYFVRPNFTSEFKQLGQLDEQKCLTPKQFHLIQYNLYLLLSQLVSSLIQVDHKTQITFNEFTKVVCLK